MARGFGRKKFCRFTVEGVKEIDYKDLDTLKATLLKQVKSFRVVSLEPVLNTSVS